MLTSLDIRIPGRIYAKRLLDEISECCDHNINLIPCNDYYALRLLVRELSVDRIPNGDEHILYYFVFSREIDGDYKKLRKGKTELVEELMEYRNKKRNKPLKTLDSFIRSLGGY